MIRFDKAKNVVVMDLVDLEHCGFTHDKFLSELFLSGMTDIDDSPRDPNCDPRFPMAIIANVAGGHVLADGTSEEKLVAYRERQAKFEMWLGTISLNELRLKMFESIAQYAAQANKEPYLDFAKVNRIISDLVALAQNPTPEAKNE